MFVWTRLAIEGKCEKEEQWDGNVAAPHKPLLSTQRTQTRAAQRRGSAEGRQGGQVNNTVHSPSCCWLVATCQTHPLPTSQAKTPQCVGSGPQHSRTVNLNVATVFHHLPLIRHEHFMTKDGTVIKAGLTANLFQW